MRTVLSKSKGVKHATVRVVKQWLKGRFIKATVKNSTTSDTIGLAVLITLLFALSHAMPIELDNQKDIE